MELSARLNSGEELGGRVLKVDHAGEHGAVNIYAGQIFMARLTARDHDRSSAHLQAGRFWPKILFPVVALSTEAVIWLGMHL